MPQIFRFVNGGQLIQIINIVAAVFLKWIDGEIRNAERSQVLEKVCALTRIDAVVGQSAFYYHPGVTNMRPFYRYTEPRVARAPSARTDEHVVTFFFLQIFIHFFDIVHD